MNDEYQEIVIEFEAVTVHRATVLVEKGPLPDMLAEALATEELYDFINDSSAVDGWINDPVIRSASLLEQIPGAPEGFMRANSDEITLLAPKLQVQGDAVILTYGVTGWERRAGRNVLDSLRQMPQALLIETLGYKPAEVAR